MKRRLLLFLLAASLGLAGRARADVVLLNFTGFDYDVPSPASTHYLDVGDQYHSLGFVTSVDPTLLGSYVDFDVNQYTYYMFNMVVDVSFVFGSFLEADFSNTSGARTRYYEDAIG